MPTYGPAADGAAVEAGIGFAEKRQLDTTITPHSATRATWGPRLGAKPKPAAGVKIRRWQPHQAGSMRGFLSAGLPSGLIVNDMKLMVGPKGSLWIAMLPIKRVDRDGNTVVRPDGKVLYSKMIEFANLSAADRFRDTVLNAFRRQHPEVLA